VVPHRFNGVLCLAIGGGSKADGAKAILWPCNGGPEQSWYIGGPTVFPIVNDNSDRCLAIGGGSQAPGARAIQWTCNGGQEQDWWFYNS
jgi:alcohol dehydrogenase YqhD (iron-dependent ADH family)